MSRHEAQKGMVLIVVLVVLAVVTIIGVAAMRSSNLNLVMATNAQVNMLLYQASDAGINAVLDSVQSNAGAALASTGAVGEALLRPGVESNRCFTVTNKLATGNCDPTASNQNMSARGASFVQMSSVVPVNAAGEAKTAETYGTDTDAVNVMAGYEVRVLSTSAMPDFTGVSGTTAKTCFAKPADDSSSPTTESVTDCMNTNGVASVTTVQEFCLGYICQ